MLGVQHSDLEGMDKFYLHSKYEQFCTLIHNVCKASLSLPTALLEKDYVSLADVEGNYNTWCMMQYSALEIKIRGIIPRLD